MVVNVSENESKKIFKLYDGNSIDSNKNTLIKTYPKHSAKDYFPKCL